MSPAITQLMLKDWQFNKKYLLTYFAVAVVGLVLMALAETTSFYISVTLLVSIIIIMGIHMIMATIINERKDSTFLFSMSLPMSYVDYSKAKLTLNFVVFFGLWLVISGAIAAIVMFTEALPNGILSFASIALLELMVAYVLVLCVAMLTESEIVTIVVTSICNVSVSIFWFLLFKMDAIASQMESATFIWHSSIVYALAIEVLLIVLMFGITWQIQRRKREFI